MMNIFSIFSKLNYNNKQSSNQAVSINLNKWS